ncbi:hypothetical protein [Sphingomonas crusticola]|uniref:hypothetical protein n=1 Tax=Sphingomonas crusticola TaxID=1697973 RepID=UPI000E22E70C|nr:hypothetical protein [Sphingomonas crusticola]
MSLSTLLIAGLVAAQPPAAVDRWRQDVAVARTDFLRQDRSFTPERRALADERLARLAEAIPALTGQQIVAELARVAALADNGHTRAYLLRNRGWWRRYPIRIWKFSDGWRIIATRPEQQALLGARITGIAGKSMHRAEAAVRPLYAGPPTWAGYMATYSLTSPDALLGTGVIRGDGRVRLGLEKDGRRFAASVAPSDEPRRTVPEESWWFLSPAHPAARGWVQVLAGRALPAYLEQPGTWYDLRRCGAGLLYFAFNRAEDQPGRPTLAEFGERVLAEIARAPRARLIVDLRFNTGGNLQKTQGLFEQIAHSPLAQERGRLFVILGPSTFSAGITPAAILAQDGKPVFVGSAPGDRLFFWAEGGNVLLPNSGINLHYADRAHIYAPGGPAVPADLVYLRLNARSLTPSLPASLSFADYVRGRDPAAERIAPTGLRCDAD